MPKVLENKLGEFTRAFQREVESAPGSGSLREKKLTALREYLQNDDNPLNFSECVGLYKIVLEQDKAFQFRQKKNWHREEVQILTFIVSELYLAGQLDIELIEPEQWEMISGFFNGRTADDCKFKWLSISKHPINGCAWDADEEALLRTILRDVDYENERPRWNKIAKLFNARSHRNAQIYRSSKELKRKWVSKICKIEKGLWRKEEDLLLFESVRQFGKKWSYISKKMHEMRTENGVKNRFLSVMDKEISSCMTKKKIPSSEDHLINKIIKRLQEELENSDRGNDVQEDRSELVDPQSSGRPQEKSQSKERKNIQLVNIGQEGGGQPSHQFAQVPAQPMTINPMYYQYIQPIPNGQYMAPVLMNWNIYGQIPIAVLPNQLQFQYNQQ